MTLKAPALLLALSLACSAWQPGEKAALGAELADLGTTAYGLGTGRASEANPLLGRDETALLVSVALTTALHFIIRNWLDGRPEEEQRRTWRIVAGLRFTAAGWNLTQLQGDAK